jgi:hypothetical protein
LNLKSEAFDKYSEIVDMLVMEDNVAPTKWLNRYVALEYDGEPFVAFAENTLVVALEAEDTAIINLSGVQPFQPPHRNRPMPRWFAVDKALLRRWPEFARRALRRVQG